MSKLLAITPELLAKTCDGLIFSQPLVPPVLEGRKTVTRRMSKKWLRRRKGDLLFVRETWAPCYGEGVDNGVVFRADGYLRNGCPDPKYTEVCNKGCVHFQEHKKPHSQWRSSMLLPRLFARCVLRLTEDPRLERVQEITEEDAKREGVPLVPMCTIDTYPEWMRRVRAARPHRTAFQVTWESLHTKDGERWEDNPEVVRIAFERIA